ncbi:MAG: biotin/lipoyl-binding protein [Candidatus Ancillula sp.]|nr:biotin/lipoyl-binding protein [Candidatus Ancillula sp.]
MKISKILIANRGEIALRVVRTARDLGILSVAIYSDQDRNAPYVKLADEAYSLEGDNFADTYLNGTKVLEIATKSGADALHPGYGFLSENAEFAAACTDAGVKWLGPSSDAINALGDKVKARKVAEAAKVSPVPGISDFIESADVVKRFIDEHGYPVILKRADGGGGQGITVVRDKSGLDVFLSAHSHDISYYFIERFVENARHVETQSARDTHGNFAVISTRDCSVQRRNQKLIEEAPAPFVDDEMLERLYTWSKSLFETVGYEGLGTCEYLLETKSDGTKALYFLEVNPRLQVEHTVSEEVSGIDLVAEQIHIAEGEALSKSGNLALNDNFGHSIELRITSESPYNGMTPTGGTIEKINWPCGHGIRLEPGIQVGDVVTTDFDSMVAKIIITGRSRQEAIARTKRALKEFELVGISTPHDLFDVVFDDSDFTSQEAMGFKVSTKWLENKIIPQFEESSEIPDELKQSPSKGNNESEAKRDEKLKSFTVEIDGKRSVLKLPESLLGSFGQSSTSTRQALAPRRSSLLSRRQNADDTPIDTSDPSVITSPMQGIVVSVPVEPGTTVKSGDLVAVLEAMKMEKFITATKDGVVEEVNITAGDSVKQGQVLIKLQLESEA